ncbi:hypothetical protein BC830DRAFT_1100811 [Chytriomyces sp. MP71]|nr:hypothetical protein BC830DRAFT_1100811 [Chytriomyces sp. MP71]
MEVDSAVAEVASMASRESEHVDTGGGEGGGGGGGLAGAVGAQLETVAEGGPAETEAVIVGVRQLQQEEEALAASLAAEAARTAGEMEHADEDVATLSLRLAKAQTRAATLRAQMEAAEKAAKAAYERAEKMTKWLAGLNKTLSKQTSPSLPHPQPQPFQQSQPLQHQQQHQHLLETRLIDVKASPQVRIDRVRIRRSDQDPPQRNSAAAAAPAADATTAITSYSHPRYTEDLHSFVPDNRVFSLPCLAFNSQPRCTDTLCPFPHVCLYCKGSHPFTACLEEKPCICPYFNSASHDQCIANKCSRLNACLFCLGDHPISRCELARNADHNTSCNNWNATGYCVADLKASRGCQFRHVCTRCGSPDHPTIACPSNAATLLENPRLDWIQEAARRVHFVTRRDFARTSEGRSSGGGSGRDVYRGKGDGHSGGESGGGGGGDYNSSWYSTSPYSKRGGDRERERERERRNGAGVGEFEDRRASGGGSRIRRSRRSVSRGREREASRGGSTRWEEGVGREDGDAPQQPQPQQDALVRSGSGDLAGHQQLQHSDSPRNSGGSGDSAPTHVRKRARREGPDEDGGGESRGTPDADRYGGNSQRRGGRVSGGGGRVDDSAGVSVAPFLSDDIGEYGRYSSRATRAREEEEEEAAMLVDRRSSFGGRDRGGDRDGGGRGDRDRERDRDRDRERGGDGKWRASSGIPPPNSGVTADGEKTKPCFAFNDGRKCPHGPNCWYRHACKVCQSTTHGEVDCPDRA